jgi:predicted ester cyclase
MSSIEENKIIARRFLELVGEHKVEELCEMIAPAWTMHGGPPKLSPGPDGLRELFATFGPIEQKWTIEDVIAEGDKVVVRATNACLQESFLGIPSTAPQKYLGIHAANPGEIPAPSICCTFSMSC